MNYVERSTEALSLIREATDSAEMKWYRREGSNSVFGLLGCDLFELISVEGEAMELRHQDISWLLLKADDDWRFFDNVRLSASLEDELSYVARRQILDGVLARLRACSKR
jgi:hypothetical protein